MGKKNCIIFLFFNTPKIWLVSYFTLYVYIIIEYDILHQQQTHQPPKYFWPISNKRGKLSMDGIHKFHFKFTKFESKSHLKESSFQSHILIKW